MARNPQCKPPAKPVEPSLSPFWTNPDSKDIPPHAVVDPDDNEVAGLIRNSSKALELQDWSLDQDPVSDQPQLLCEDRVVKVPAFWYRIMNVHQLQHALASMDGQTSRMI